MAEDTRERNKQEKIIFLTPPNSQFWTQRSQSLSSFSTACEVRAGYFFMDLLFGGFPVVEGVLAAEFGILRKKCHWGSFKGRQCSQILSNVDFLESNVQQLEFDFGPADERALKSSHISSEQLWSRHNADPNLHCLCCPKEVNKGIFGLTFILGTRLYLQTSSAPLGKQWEFST